MIGREDTEKTVDTGLCTKPPKNCRSRRGKTQYGRQEDRKADKKYVCQEAQEIGGEGSKKKQKARMKDSSKRKENLNEGK